jgi:hypothetical protein
MDQWITFLIIHNRIGGVMVNVLASSVVNRGFEHRSGQTKDYKIEYMYYVYITGGNTGIGKATAYELARRNAKIIIACRNDIKGEAVARNIKIKTGNPFVSCSRLDLSNQRSIREFTASVV